jgi:SagB-type dehydrogenase family enzyme
MPRIDLPSPTLRAIPEPWSSFTFQAGSKQYLPLPSDGQRDPGFFSTLHSRRTRRNLGELTRDRLSQLLWHSCKVKWAMPASFGIRCQHRSVPSAGGLHCIDVVIISGTAATVYDPIGHSLQALDVEGAALSKLLQETVSVIGIGSGTVIWFVADFDLMLSKYENGESLVWRDAGCLCATMCLVAEALQLGCCPIGITGEPHLSDMLNSRGRIAGVGGILIGASLEF